MFLDLRELKRSGKDKADFFFEYVPLNSLVDIPSTELVTPVKVCGEVFLTDAHSAFLQGEVAFTLKGECTRCLEPAENEIIAKFNEQVEQNNQEGYSLVNDKIDLSQIVDDAILTNLPISFLCKEDCKGICPSCGANLNDEQCKCNNR